MYGLGIVYCKSVLRMLTLKLNTQILQIFWIYKDVLTFFSAEKTKTKREIIITPISEKIRVLKNESNK